MRSEQEIMRIMREDIIHVLPSPPETPLTIELAGISFCDKSYYISRADSGKAVLEYIVSGSGSLVVNGEFFKPIAGDVYLIPPYTDHYYASDADTPWHKLWFNISGPLVRPLLTSYHLDDQILFRQCPLQSFFEEGLHILRKQLLPPEIAAPRIILPIFAGLWSFLQNDSSTPNPASLKEYIASQPGVKLSLRDLSKYSGRSVSQTIRIFKKAFQSTPYAENLANRISAATNLLANSELPIKEIAFSLGFRDPYYFSRIFRRKTGLSPSACRAQSRSLKPKREGWAVPPKG